MPIEIRELVIKAAVVQSGSAGTSNVSGSSNNTVSGSEEVINTCIEKMLEILKEKNER